MKYAKKQSRELAGLLDELEREIRGQLLTHEIYDLHAYAWLDHDTPNPEFAGHHIWEIDPPFEPEWQSLTWDEGPVRYRPTNQDEEFHRSGTDFEGLMEMSRSSIGLLLCYESVSQDDFLADSFGFWLQFVSSMMLLGAASDRLRDFFVMAFFQKSSGEYARSNKEYGEPRDKLRKYCSPFDRADPTCCQNASESLLRLRELAKTISEFRKERNKIVHEVATHVARSQVEILRRQQSKFDNERLDGYQSPPIASFEEIQTFGTVLQSHAKQEYRDAAERAVSWYRVLVHASSLVFEIEHCIRDAVQ